LNAEKLQTKTIFTSSWQQFTTKTTRSTNSSLPRRPSRLQRRARPHIVAAHDGRVDQCRCRNGRSSPTAVTAAIVASCQSLVPQGDPHVTCMGKRINLRGRMDAVVSASVPDRAKSCTSSARSSSTRW
jgi:hypothetical protein